MSGCVVRVRLLRAGVSLGLQLVVVAGWCSGRRCGEWSPVRLPVCLEYGVGDYAAVGDLEAVLERPDAYLVGCDAWVGGVPVAGALVGVFAWVAGESWGDSVISHDASDGGGSDAELAGD